MGKEKEKSSCREWQILVGERALGTINERDRASLERHLAGCPRCRQALAETERMYRLMEGFELAKAKPFLAAKVERALRGEGAAGEPEKAAFPLWRWLRAPAFAPVAAAVSAAVVVGVLYFNVWAPSAAEKAGAPVADKAAAPAGKEDRGLAEETRAPLAKERPAREPAPPLAEVAPPLAKAAPSPEPVPLPGELPAAGEATLKLKFAEESRAVTADALTLSGVTEEAEKKKAAVRRSARGDVTAADEIAAFARPALGKLEDKELTAADVEAWMDARFEAEVERLTGDDAAFVEYVTPNGLLMAYFYELTLEEQRTLLSRLRREAEAASAADMLLSH
jgi:hypothetical protein